MTKSVTVLIPSALRPQVDNLDSIDVAGSSVSEVLGSLVNRYPHLRQRLFSGDHEVNRFINFYVNDEDIRFLENLETAVKPGDELAIVPAIAGG